MAECPVCDAQIEKRNNTILGELILCSDCGSELEVISIDPFRVEEAPLEEEDWGE